ncbi:DUF481 domain-containing protein [Altericroceibacterium endophyticum]|uniref:DUF481 domain-containing protein n=1 Tax=Altericroceibacterium endophyticum TaxID=1808508 RepID=A0A6I4T616_9SPHN|nr:DUF481 domain-containing protein [Altericroceibacterium endophyticum]MXO66287.1 DUF481 domain-containing protein [Altericroceibacterium endophyticum]
MYRVLTYGAALAALTLPGIAHAEIPPAVRAMLDAAIATGDRAKIATVFEIAEATYPGEKDELSALHDAFLDQTKRSASLAAKKKEARIRSASLIDMWSGEGQIGALRETGNSESLGLTAGVKMQRTGIDWRHKLHFLFDYQSTNGETTREQYLASYEPQYQLKGELFFIFGLAQFESDQFQGYDSRYSVSGGAGYRIVDSDDLQLSVQAGPAWRRTDFTDGDEESVLTGLAALNMDWKINDRVTLKQDADAYLRSENTTLSSTTSLEAALGGALSARASYAVEYATAPPDGSVTTDTLTRFTLVYGF